MNVLAVYNELLSKYGHQGWWPRHKSRKRPGFDPRFEIIVGAILTQNTAWKNVEKAIDCLSEKNLLDSEAVVAAPIKRLEVCIRPSGYYRQKAKKLKIAADFFSPFMGRSDLKRFSADEHQSQTIIVGHQKPSREDLLALWGIGRETADSILLYAFNEPIFVVDAYTRRLLAAYGQKKLSEADYDKIRLFFEKQLPRDYKLFNEYHALIVRWGKEQKSKKKKTRGTIDTIEKHEKS